MLAEKAIKYIDKPLQQVSIEVSLIELTKEDNDNLGLSFSGDAGKFSTGYSTVSGANEALAMVTDSASSAGNAAIAYNTVKSIHDGIAMKLNTLISQNKAKLLANPTVLSLDGSEALVKITDQIVSKMTVTSQNGTGTITYTPELSDIGIVLNITPKIGGDGYVGHEDKAFSHNIFKECNFWFRRLR